MEEKAAAEREAPRRLANPSESGRLPLPEELGERPDGAELPGLTDATFAEEVLGAEVPFVGDFWAESCVPCRLQEPTLRRVARERDGRARVGRLNVFENPATTDRFRIKGVPHMLVIARGEVVLELIGDHSYERLVARLREVGLYE